ncbi:double-strand break repair protein AddB [Pararhodospirillum oryzae]|uniref:Double-strand break repair protein AddB n=1 Tax=Pararhodospirillum oryzae TaxID=478448 RepID=A0A512HBG2_9PROT|nr:double-strand break repair protein AddB [Pararhodospirillum oryzae]GEO82778.1 double-strand break repair protein AddB [Pararhodospirillum oryzae]
MPAVASIPAALPFLDTLAAGLIATLGRNPDPLALASATVLLPTRRACRALREALLRAQGGQASLTPRIVPLGHLEEDETLGAETLGADPLGAGRGETLDLPPALPGPTRLVLLTRLVLARSPDMTPAQATRLAGDLARLLDQAQTEGVDLNRLPDLLREAPRAAELARHWHLTVDFLGLLTTVWPPLLEAHGALDAAEHRNRVLARQAAAWARHPPAGPILAAGSTGSIPATAALLRVIADLPQGLVILPGLDTSLDEESWNALEDTHPQAGLRRLLEDLGLTRADVRPYPPPGVDLPHLTGCASPARARLVSEALRPAATTDAWRHLGPVAPELAGALEGLSLVEAPTEREEAAAIAVVLREALETPGRTAALVTPDRTLARRVVAALDRWGMQVDDSAGQPLGLTPVGTFLRLAAHAVAENLAPVPLLALLQHPLAAGGEAPAVFRARARRLDREVLRGPRPAPGFAGLAAALAPLAKDAPRTHASLSRALSRLEALAAPFIAVMARPGAPLADLLEAHLRFAEALAAARVDGVLVPGPARLWAGEAGEAAALALAALAEAAPPLDNLAPRHYPALFDALIGQGIVRPRFDRHPRLALWGPLEARLQRPDVLILGGLNEGTWPAQVETGPWMSRPMMDVLGLPQPERRVGLAAHDIAQALHAPTLVLTRSTRVEGSPTVPSRWLTRLQTVVGAAGLGEAFARARAAGAARLAWARALEQPEGPPVRAPQPAPCPPVEVRPRRLSATRVETWMRDPYAIYAEFILGLRPLDPLDADPSRAEYGTLIHKALEDFVIKYPEALPENVETELIALGTERFKDHMARPGVRTFWWPRFQRIAAWIAREEVRRRPDLLSVWAEATARLTLEGPAGSFLLTATADRLERRRDGTVGLIDYKTGMPPSAREIGAGLAPQLPLEAALAQRGGFKEVGNASVGELAFWRLTGTREGGQARLATADPAEAAKTALDGLKGLIAVFDRPETPYLARPHPDHAPRFNPYQHLARVGEWAGAEDE